jgi:hypothetical protein
MPEWIDPTADAVPPPTFDFEGRQAAMAQRKALLAQLMRKQAEGAPEGRMVGGQYIPPSLAQHLAPLVASYRAGQERDRLQADEADYSRADQAAAQAHVASRPRGPSFDGTGPFREPTTQDVTEWAQKGAAIPSRRDVVAKIITDQEVNAPIREEDKAFRAREAEADRAARAEDTRARLEQRAEEMRQRAEDAAASRADRAAAAREAAALRLQIAQLAHDSRTNAAANKPLPSSVHKELSEAESNASAISQLRSTFDDNYSGLKATLRNTVAPYDPTNTLDDSGAQWWKTYKKQSSLLERHAMFGASLTQNEQAAWNSADINERMTPATIRKNLAVRERLAAKVYANGVDRYEKGGYPQVRNAFDPAKPRSSGAEGSWDAPTAPKVRKFNPATGRLE